VFFSASAEGKENVCQKKIANHKIICKSKLSSLLLQSISKKWEDSSLNKSHFSSAGRATDL
jgi:hypothetical protein